MIDAQKRFVDIFFEGGYVAASEKSQLQMLQREYALYERTGDEEGMAYLDVAMARANELKDGREDWDEDTKALMSRMGGYVTMRDMLREGEDAWGRRQRRGRESIYHNEIRLKKDGGFAAPYDAVPMVPYPIPLAYEPLSGDPVPLDFVKPLTLTHRAEAKVQREGWGSALWETWRKLGNKSRKQVGKVIEKEHKWDLHWIGSRVSMSTTEVYGGEYLFDYGEAFYLDGGDTRSWMEQIDKGAAFDFSALDAWPESIPSGTREAAECLASALQESCASGASRPVFVKQLLEYGVPSAVLGDAYDHFVTLVSPLVEGETGSTCPELLGVGAAGVELAREGHLQAADLLFRMMIEGVGYSEKFTGVCDDIEILFSDGLNVVLPDTIAVLVSFLGVSPAARDYAKRLLIYARDRYIDIGKIEPKKERDGHGLHGTIGLVAGALAQTLGQRDTLPVFELFRDAGYRGGPVYPYDDMQHGVLPLYFARELRLNWDCPGLKDTIDMLLRCAVRDGWEHELYLQAAHEAVEAELSEAQVTYFYEATRELLRG